MIQNGIKQRVIIYEQRIKINRHDLTIKQVTFSWTTETTVRPSHYRRLRESNLDVSNFYKLCSTSLKTVKSLRKLLTFEITSS